MTIKSPQPVPTDKAYDIQVYVEHGACGSQEAEGPNVCGLYIQSPTK